MSLELRWTSNFASPAHSGVEETEASALCQDSNVAIFAPRPQKIKTPEKQN
jgi:hypothetical protein